MRDGQPIQESIRVFVGDLHTTSIGLLSNCWEERSVLRGKVRVSVSKGDGPTHDLIKNKKLD